MSLMCLGVQSLIYYADWSFTVGRGKLDGRYRNTDIKNDYASNLPLYSHRRTEAYAPSLNPQCH